MEQRSFAEARGFRRQEKVTRRERFLEEMERVMPWQRLEKNHLAETLFGEVVALLTERGFIHFI